MRTDRDVRNRAPAPRRRPIVAAIALAIALPSACAPLADGTSLRGEQAERERREELVAAIEASGVRDSTTLAALRRVPRHEFVRPSERAYAYLDEALPIAEGQTISQPSVVALMTEALRPRPGMKVLEIGTGSGYQAAVLAAAGCRVYSIEIVRALADSARALLGRLGYGAVRVRHGDGYLGWPEEAPFDGIVVTAAPDTLPQALVDQLARGGRLVAPVGPEGRVQRLVLVERDAGGRVHTRPMLPVRFVPMRRGLR